MSAGGAFGGGRGPSTQYLQKREKKDYISCLKSSGHESKKCRLFSKKYLECRMEKHLMASQDMSELGFGKDADLQASREEKPPSIDKRSSE